MLRSFTRLEIIHRLFIMAEFSLLDSRNFVNTRGPRFEKKNIQSEDPFLKIHKNCPIELGLYMNKMEASTNLNFLKTA